MVQTSIENRLRVLIQMSLVVAWNAHVPVVRIIRGAGQFGKLFYEKCRQTISIFFKLKIIFILAAAKPRSSEFETINGEKVYSFRGDNVNGHAVSDRKPDPNRLVSSCRCQFNLTHAPYAGY